MKVKKERRAWKPMKEDKETTRLYQFHHMHHFNKKGRITHEVHHCYAFSRKDMTGKKYKICHIVGKGRLWHCLELKGSGIIPKTIYNHAKKSYRIKLIKIYGKIFYGII